MYLLYMVFSTLSRVQLTATDNNSLKRKFIADKLSVLSVTELCLSFPVYVVT